MKKKRMIFCTECREESEYELRIEKCKRMIKGKEYEFKLTKAYCMNCHEQIVVPGLIDLNNKEIDEQYRAYENIITIEEINALMKMYSLGKSTLSLVLGFGEITITRYLEGQIPSSEYSLIMKKALVSPNYMKTLLEENRHKISGMAYKKANEANKRLKEISSLSEPMQRMISYIFKQQEEITPLALQKLLYYIQGISMALYNESIYQEDCYAWKHGPVYKKVYYIFKDFSYDPIDDTRFMILKDKYQEMNEKEKLVADLVIDTFGQFSGKMLELLTHKEIPWQKARNGYSIQDGSNEIIDKKDIEVYFKEINGIYNISTVKGINQYIAHMLAKKEKFI